MKTIIALASLVCLALAAYAYAEPVGGSYYANTVYSAAGTASTAVYSNPFHTASNGTKKTIAFFGYSSSTSAIPPTGAMSGTAALQMDVSGTGAGPWVAAKDANGTAITGTSNAIWDLDQAVLWYRVVWTKTGSANQKLLANILYHD